MNLKKTNCLAVLMVICVLLSLIIGLKTDAYSRDLTNGELVKKIVKEQEINNSYIGMETTKEEIEISHDYDKVINLVSKSIKSKNVYADCYGGSYLTDDGNLIVEVTDATSEKAQEILNNTSEHVKIIEVVTSYNELQDRYKRISEKFANLAEMQLENGIEDLTLNNLTSNMVGISIDVKKNSVKVILKEVTDEAKAQFALYYEEDVIFEEGEVERTDASLIKLGRAIYNSNRSKASVGMKAYYTDSSGRKVKGFVTVAHLVQNVGDSIYLDGTLKTKIGKVTKRQYGGNMDAAFVEITNSNYAPSRKVYYSDSKGTISDKYVLDSYSYLSDTYVGAYIYKSGSTTFLTRGKIVDTNVTVMDGGTGIVLTDLWRATYNCANGDSGGAVFDANFNAIAGIHHGHNNSNTTGSSTKWENITDTWDLYEY